MPETTSRTASILGQDVDYEVRRSDEATEERIDVDIHGVQVILPENNTTDPEVLLSENAAWVMEKKQKYDSYREQVPDREFEPGEMFPYLGEEYEIVVEKRPSSEIAENALRLAEHHVEQTSIKRALETFYQRKAREYFGDEADRLADQMGVKYEQIEVRNQRTKWGSCSTTGTLGLNWRLMMAPPEIVDYVVVHELAHLREANHGDEFWSLVEEYDPEYEEHAEWLNENSARLVFSEGDL